MPDDPTLSAITPDDLAAHVVAAAPHGHAQPLDAVDGCDPGLLAWWHTWEHTPRRGWPTGQKHAHDEFTAHREGVDLHV